MTTRQPYRYAHLTWPEINDAIARQALVVLLLLLLLLPCCC